ncbi:hypothetical protein OS493_029809 [Desmophyllum pertusum]|uniref:Uncharacterized protein n=1 Tax=Desmophyllum pertusum TaxID=174260 RepID=A0A9W9YN85_9CNID|nr:hypothetical protein OS493_029809 [Desmophyllum pertusum]
MATFMYLLVVSVITLNSALSARIAGFSGVPKGSHYIVIKKAMEELYSRGHEVVLVKPSLNQKDSAHNGGFLTRPMATKRCRVILALPRKL